jgi:hypothetical protein
VLAFALAISIGAIGWWAGREQLPIHLRAIACRDCGAMSASSHFAFNREQHLLGASGALPSDREQGVRNVQDGKSIRVRHCATG